jgi:hypothetical protein
VLVIGGQGGAADVVIYNNLIYGHNDGASLYVGYSSEGYPNVYMYNNSIYSELDSTEWGMGVVVVNPQFWDFGFACEFINNIVHQAGAGRCVEWHGHENDLAHHHNIFFHPNGELGFDPAALADGESEQDPLWEAIPQGPYHPTFARLTGSLPGADLSNVFSTDINGNPRTRWDMGAFEF